MISHTQSLLDFHFRSLFCFNENHAVCCGFGDENHAVCYGFGDETCTQLGHLGS